MTLCLCSKNLPHVDYEMWMNNNFTGYQLQVAWELKVPVQSLEKLQQKNAISS
jgi:hypothetical protein